jgi:hypothetical protein
MQMKNFKIYVVLKTLPNNGIHADSHITTPWTPVMPSVSTQG